MSATEIFQQPGRSYVYVGIKAVHNVLPFAATGLAVMGYPALAILILALSIATGVMVDVSYFRSIRLGLHRRDWRYITIHVADNGIPVVAVAAALVGIPLAAIALFMAQAGVGAVCDLAFVHAMRNGSMK